MAENPKEVLKLLKNIYKKAETKAKEDLKELKKYFSLKKLNSYDIAYYSRILKEQKYEIDEKELKEFFEFENVLKYLHRFIENFYGVEIKDKRLKTKENVLYSENVRIYEIYKDKKLISYYFLDPFFRKGKRPGAWADNLR
jgi:Zn-dependent oligopeptidase